MIRPLIICMTVLHALNFIHTLTEDCSIRVICVQFIKMYGLLEQY